MYDVSKKIKRVYTTLVLSRVTSLDMSSSKRGYFPYGNAYSNEMMS